MGELYLVCRFPNVDEVGRFTRAKIAAGVAGRRLSGDHVCRLDNDPGGQWHYLDDFLRLPPSAPPAGPVLVPCQVCGTQISSHAESCPRCGHPNAPAARPASGPKCYACDSPSTTRCQRCEAFSCPLHLSSVSVMGGGHQLRCKGCRSSAVTTWVVYAVLIAAIIIAQVIYFGFWRGSGQ